MSCVSSGAQYAEHTLLLAGGGGRGRALLVYGPLGCHMPGTPTPIDEMCMSSAQPCIITGAAAVHTQGAPVPVNFPCLHPICGGRRTPGICVTSYLEANINAPPIGATSLINSIVTGLHYPSSDCTSPKILQTCRLLQVI